MHALCLKGGSRMPHKHPNDLTSTEVLTLNALVAAFPKQFQRSVYICHEQEVNKQEENSTSITSG